MICLVTEDPLVIVVDGIHKNDGYDGKHESRKNNDFRPASSFSHGKHEFSNDGTSC